MADRAVFTDGAALADPAALAEVDRAATSLVGGSAMAETDPADSTYGAATSDP